MFLSEEFCPQGTPGYTGARRLGCTCPACGCLACGLLRRTDDHNTTRAQKRDGQHQGQSATPECGYRHTFPNRCGDCQGAVSMGAQVMCSGYLPPGNNGVVRLGVFSTWVSTCLGKPNVTGAGMACGPHRQGCRVCREACRFFLSHPDTPDRSPCVQRLLIDKLQLCSPERPLRDRPR